MIVKEIGITSTNAILLANCDTWCLRSQAVTSSGDFANSIKREAHPNPGGT
jgi:hypothetical protein